MYDASSNCINCHGHTNIDVNIGGHLFTLSVIVCDIRQDGIIGQDFLLKYVQNIDYKTGKITTQFNQIQCWIGSDKPFSCCVVVRRTTVVPANSVILLPVEVSSKDKLTKNGYVEPIPSERSAALILPGVLPIQDDMRVSFVNCSDSQMTLRAKQNVGTCEPYIYSNIIERKQVRIITDQQLKMLQLLAMTCDIF